MNLVATELARINIKLNDLSIFFSSTQEVIHLSIGHHGDVKIIERRKRRTRKKYFLCNIGISSHHSISQVRQPNEFYSSVIDFHTMDYVTMRTR